MKKVILINGIGTSGKNTFVDLIAESKLRVTQHSTVDIFKEFVEMASFETNIKKTEKYRRLLSDIKNLFTNYNDFPFKQVINIINNFYSEHNKFNLLFIHVRELEEIQRILNYCNENNFDCSTLLIKCTIKENLFTALPLTDSTNIYNFKYDYVIENNGTIDDLRSKAKNFINLISDIDKK